MKDKDVPVTTITDWCIECQKPCSKNEKTNGICIDCHNKIFKRVK